MKLKLGNAMGAVWKGFNYWRKRYWPIRLFILVALAIPLLLENYLLFGESTVNRTVRNACLYIQYSSQPPVINAWLHYNSSLEKQRLLLSLKAIENKLSAQEHQELNTKPSKADLKQLFTLAKKYGILPASTNLRDIKRSILASAIYETKLRFDPEYEKITRSIDSCKHPNYMSWSTWINGLNNFIGLLRVTIFPNSWKAILSWLCVCFFSGALISTVIPEFKQTCSVILATAFTVTLVNMSHASSFLFYGNDPVCWYWYILHNNYFVPYYISQICFAAATALFGCRIFVKINRNIDIKISEIITWTGFSLATLGTGIAMHLDYAQYYWDKDSSALPLMVFSRKNIFMENLFYSISLAAFAWALSLIYSLHKSKINKCKEDDLLS